MQQEQEANFPFYKPSLTKMRIIKIQAPLNTISTKLFNKKREVVRKLNFQEIINTKTPIDKERLKNLRKTFRSSKSSTNINLQLYKYDDMETRDISDLLQALAKYKSLTLQRLTLNFSINNFLRGDRLKILTRQLRRLKQLKKFELSLNYVPRMSDIDLKALSKCLGKLKSLESMKLGVSGCHEVTDKGIECLEKTLRGKLKFLRSFDFEFDGCTDIRSYGFNRICELLEGFAGLKEICLKFGEYAYYIDQEAIKNLGLVLKKSSKLENIVLDFKMPELIEGETLEILCGGIQENSASLKSLVLKFPELDLTACHLDCLYKTLENLISLQRIDLTFRKCLEFDSQEMSKLAESLVSIKTLRILRLDFSEYCLEIGDEGLISLGNCFKVLSQLEDVHLEFLKNHNITDQGLIGLSEGLKEVPGLRRLGLSFVGSKNINDLGISKLSENLKNNTKLQHLMLNFGFCGDITDKGLSGLCEALMELLLLKSLELNFSSLTQITDEVLMHLGECLKTHYLFENFSVCFKWCNRLTDRGLKYLCNALEKQVMLQEINLDFFYCERITKQSLDHVARFIKELGYIQRIFLEFTGGEDIYFGTMKNLKEECLKKPRIEVLNLLP